MNPATDSPLQARLHSLWTRNLPLVRDRLDLLDRAALAAGSAALTAPMRQEAAGTAHKLAGSLGMFGFVDGTAIARELELLLETPGSHDPATPDPATPDPATPDPAKLASLVSQLRSTLRL